MSAYFVTATGTGIGKTYVTCGLVRHLKASALKPVISGIDETNFAQSDSALLLEAMGEAVTPENIARISPWRFKEPLSPDMAALRERRSINFGALVEFSRGEIAEAKSPLLIEGVGGVMVPLDLRFTVLDWISALKIPVLLVTGSYLGTLSHTLTALDALRCTGARVAGVVVNESEYSTVTLEETVESLQRFATGVSVAPLSRNVPQFGHIAGLLKA